MDPIWWIAPAAALAYIVISLVIGDVFPFSKYSMYASIGRRDHGAVLYVKADGVFVRVDELVDFHGIDLDQVYPSGIPCSLEWQVHEAKRWLGNHKADAPGPVAVEMGFRLIWVAADGKITEKLRPTVRGTARRA